MSEESKQVNEELTPKEHFRNTQTSGFCKLYDLIWLLSLLEESPEYKQHQTHTRNEMFDEVKRQFNEAIRKNNDPNHSVNKYQFLSVCNLFKQIEIEDTQSFEWTGAWDQVLQVIHYILFYNMGQKMNSHTTFKRFNNSFQFYWHDSSDCCDYIDCKCVIQLNHFVKYMIQTFIHDHCEKLVSISN
jgi:hypothetical protein